MRSDSTIAASLNGLAEARRAGAPAAKLRPTSAEGLRADLAGSARRPETANQDAKASAARNFGDTIAQARRQAEQASSRKQAEHMAARRAADLAATRRTANEAPVRQASPGQARDARPSDEGERRLGQRRADETNESRSDALDRRPPQANHEAPPPNAVGTDRTGTAVAPAVQATDAAAQDEFPVEIATTASGIGDDRPGQTGAGSLRGGAASAVGGVGNPPLSAAVAGKADMTESATAEFDPDAEGAGFGKAAGSASGSGAQLDANAAAKGSTGFAERLALATAAPAQGGGASAAAGASPAEAQNAPAPAPIHVTILATPVGHAEFPARLAGESVSLALMGVERAEITLAPRELGPVRIELSLNGESARVAFAAVQPETRQAIEQSLPVLKDMLAEHGLLLSDTSVSEHPGGGARDGQAFGQGPGRGSGTEPEGPRREPLKDAAGPWPSRTGGLGQPVALRGLIDLYA